MTHLRQHQTDLMCKVSIVIPTRDREDILADCLERLLAQQGPPCEVIVVDASSSEATQEILSEYPSVVNRRLGDVPYSMVLGRNVGLSLARGEIVAFIDDDCYVLPGWLRALAAAFDDPEVIAAGGRVIYHPWKRCAHGEPVAVLDLDRDVVWGQWDRTLDGIIEVPHLPGGNCAVRRQVALEVGGFDTNFVGSANLEETDFFIRVSKMGGRMVFVPSAVVEHRAAPRSDQIGRTQTNFVYRYSMVRNRLYLLRKHGGAGLGVDVRRQALDLVAGTAKMLWGGIVFAAASTAGIVRGLLCRPVGESEGLDAEP